MLLKPTLENAVMCHLLDALAQSDGERVRSLRALCWSTQIIRTRRGRGRSRTSRTCTCWRWRGATMARDSRPTIFLTFRATVTNKALEASVTTVEAKHNAAHSMCDRARAHQVRHRASAGG